MKAKNANEAGVSRRTFVKEAGFAIGVPVIASGLSLAPPAQVAKGVSKKGPVSAAKGELEVLNPRGVIDPPAMLGISPRVPTLDGKRIAMIHNNKPGAKTFLEAAEELLKAKYPGATFVHFDTTINLADKPEKYAAVAVACDTFILGSGD